MTPDQVSAEAMTTTQAEQTEQSEGYVLRISRLTVDKLGVKLYDKASAVVAELVANAWDADATEVTVRAVQRGSQVVGRKPSRSGVSERLSSLT